MPLQQFRPISGRCKLCNGTVELPVSGEKGPPNECPKCGQGIEPCPSLVAPQPKVAKKPSVSEAKSAGFQVLKKLGKGEYEKQ